MDKPSSRASIQISRASASESKASKIDSTIMESSARPSNLRVDEVPPTPPKPTESSTQLD